MLWMQAMTSVITVGWCLRWWRVTSSEDELISYLNQDSDFSEAEARTP